MSDIDWTYVGTVGMYQNVRVGNIVKAYVMPKTYSDPRGVEAFSKSYVTFGTSVIPAQTLVLSGHSLYEAMVVEECKDAFGKPFRLDSGEVLHKVLLTGVRASVKYPWE